MLNFLKRSRRKKPINDYKQTCYSLEGEDILLKKFFSGRKEPGFYVDVGAHHPQRYSNTYAFYLKGWRGVNMDAAPGSMALFKQLRPRDINLEQPISGTPQELLYHVFNDPALNSFSEALSAQRANYPGYYILNTFPLQTRTLADVLNQHLPPDQTIQLMSVDVEGLDLDVLQSNDWTRFAPEVLVVEDIEWVALNAEPSAMYWYLHELGYELVSKLWKSCIYRKQPIPS